MRSKADDMVSLV